MASRPCSIGRSTSFARWTPICRTTPGISIRLVTRLRPRDCTSGYRCWRREALASVPLARLTSDGYSFLVEMLYAATAARLRFAEVPITFVERRLGESKLTRAVLFESAITPWRLIASRNTPRQAVR